MMGWMLAALLGEDDCAKRPIFVVTSLLVNFLTLNYFQIFYIQVTQQFVIRDNLSLFMPD